MIAHNPSTDPDKRLSSIRLGRYFTFVELFDSLHLAGLTGA